MRTRKHHNNDGLHSIKTGLVAKQVEKMARKIMKRNSKQKLWNDCMKLWSEIVLTRDGHKCRAQSKACWGKIDPHHIVPKTWKATALMPDNGLSLCRKHHDHDLPDYLNNLCMGIVSLGVWCRLWDIAKGGKNWKEYELLELKITLQDKLDNIKGAK
jgi:hypothetical protein